MDNYAEKVVNLEKDIKRAKREQAKEVRKLSDAIREVGFIASFESIRLYYDRVSDYKRVLRIDSGIEAEASVDGNVYATTKVTGGGARPTFTRMALGAMVGGGMGALVGGAMQKHEKIQTQTTTHDARTYRVTIKSRDGSISASSSENHHPQEFVDKVLNAVTDYPKNKEIYDKQRNELAEQLKKVQKAEKVTALTKKLETLNAGATAENKTELADYRRAGKMQIAMVAIVVAAAILLLVFIIVIAQQA